MRRKVEDDGIRVLVIDSLNGYLTAMTSERFLLAQLHELLAYLNAHGVLEAGGSVRKAISVIKNRLSAHETSIREFEIVDKGLEIGTPLRQFEGISSGIPKFVGETEDLLNVRPKPGSKGATAG